MNRRKTIETVTKVLDTIEALPDDVDILNVHLNWHEGKPVIHVYNMEFDGDEIEQVGDACFHYCKETENGVVLLRVEFGEVKDGTNP